MVRNIIQYVQSRVGEIPRERVLREVNLAWDDIWDKHDLPGCQRTMYVQDNCCSSGTGTVSSRISFPYWVHDIKGARIYNGPQVELNQPSRNFSPGRWYQEPFTWTYVGESPVERVDFNRAPPTLRLSVKPTSTFNVTIIGSVRNRDKVREVLTFEPGQISVTAENAFLTYDSITKEVLTDSNIVGYDGANIEFFTLANSRFQSRHAIWQTRGDCVTAAWVYCQYEVLYKSISNILYYDEDTVPARYEDVLMDATVARILMTEKGNEDRAQLFGNEAVAGLQAKASKEANGIENTIALGENKFTTIYRGYL